MTYYVWKPDLERVDRFSYFKDVPEGLKHFSFCSGEEIADLPVCDFVTSTSYPTDLSDLLLIGGEEIHVISTRLTRLIDSLSIKNVQYFPTRIENHKTGETTNYQILNVTSTIECLDLEHSQVTRSRRSGNVIGLEKYKIIEEKVLSDPAPSLMFRLREFAWHLLVGENFKEACEGEGITGCSFTPTEAFV